MGIWYAVLTKPRSELIARDNLLRQGFECLLPRLRRSVRTALGLRFRVEALFPRYLFVAADPQATSLAVVRSTRGCVGLVRFGAEPAQVPERVIAQIQRRASAGDGVVELDTPALRPGQRVRILDGPLAGVEAVFKSREGADRVRLLLELLGQSRETVLPLRQLASTL